MASEQYLAVDIGAESGRGMKASFDGKSLSFEEIHRFPTHKAEVHGSLFWDALAIFNEILFLLRHSGQNASSLGITTWGVDYGLLDKNGMLIGNPFHYRDARTSGMVEKVLAILSKEEIFEETGIQFMPLNTLFQLYATLQKSPWMLTDASRLLFMPDLFSFWLTGMMANEFSIASTSQIYNMKGSGGSPRGGWAFDLLKRLEIPTHIFSNTVAPGTMLGPLRSELLQSLGGVCPSLCTVCSHDTASAVFAVPAYKSGHAYLSSGTWSLLGIERKDPLISSESLHANITNEGGFGGTIRFLKNIMGLWILQECRREWTSSERHFEYEELTIMAQKAEPFFSLIDVNSEEFFFPGDMVGKIIRFCKQTGQKVPGSIGEIVRVILGSLALEYRWTLEQFEKITGTDLNVLHVVGGGSQNELLSRFTADATGKLLICGPVEATSFGNIGVQMIAAGEISTRKDFHEILERSCQLKHVEPEFRRNWDEPYERLLTIKKEKSARI
ncbi:MAG: rhamnulokinase family protein [Candidatus Ratteibacteria bacterium]